MHSDSKGGRRKIVRLLGDQLYALGTSSQGRNDSSGDAVQKRDFPWEISDPLRDAQINCMLMAHENKCSKFKC